MAPIGRMAYIDQMEVLDMTQPEVDPIEWLHANAKSALEAYTEALRVAGLPMPDDLRLAPSAPDRPRTYHSPHPSPRTPTDIAKRERERLLKAIAVHQELTSVNVELAGSGDIVIRSQHSPELILPLDLNGLRLLRNLLIVKKQTKKAELGTNAKPIQQMVEKFLKNRELEKAIEEQEQFETLKELF